MRVLEGQLKVLSKNGGIKVGDSDAWINPTPQAKIDVLNRLEEAKKELTGAVVKVSIEDNGEWSGIEIVSKSPLFSQEQKDRDERNTIIVRQNALSHATEYTKMIYEDTMTPLDVEKHIFTFAEKCERWIWRG